MADQGVLLGEAEVPGVARTAGLADHEQSLNFPLEDRKSVV